MLPDSPFLAGWSSVDLTPDSPVMLAGQFYTRVSTGVLDPITATVLALSRGDTHAVFVSCDLVGIDSRLLSEVRQRVAAHASDLDPRRIIMNATHIHTGPVFDERWYGRQPPPVLSPEECLGYVAERVADAVAAAWQKRAPAGLSRAYGHAVVGHNRRAWYADGHAEMYGKTNRDDFHGLEGFEDHSVDLLFTWDESGALSGLAANVPCPAQVSEHAVQVTADYWHEARTAIRARLGSDLPILPLCGAGGDQSPHFLIYGAQEAEMRLLRGTSEREEIGRKIADAVDYAHSTARVAAATDVSLGHIVEDISLAPRQILEREYVSAQSELERLQALPADQTDQNHAAHVSRAQSVVQRYAHRHEQKPFSVELHAVRIGDAALVTNPFELYQDFGLRIRARSRAKQTFVVQLANGYSGYLPTERALGAGSYGADPASNRVGPEGGQELVEASLAAIGQLWQ